MNITILKRGAIFSLILGGFLGLLSLIPQFIGFGIFILSFLSSIIVILYMKKNEKYLGIINTENGAILGGAIGFFTTVGFFLSFSPMIFILHLIFKKMYAYMIPEMITGGLWLFIVIILITALIFALTNAAVGMALAWLYDKIETKPEEYDAPIDIKIED